MEELIKKLEEYKQTGAIGYSTYVDLMSTALSIQVEKDNNSKNNLSVGLRR
jgi:hypothetical protein